MLYYIQYINTVQCSMVVYGVCQWPRSGFDPFVSTRHIYGNEIKPGKNSDTRIKPLPLANGHGRYRYIVT
jgi:hypothetical protein